MSRRTLFAGLPALSLTTLLAVSCSEPVGVERSRHAVPRFAPAAAPTGIALDQFNGTMFQSGVMKLVKGFNPTNPHLGDAIIATFFWSGSNSITAVNDHLTNADSTPVGNTYHLIELVSAGGITMATYVATNVQNFPDPNPDQGSVLAVQATMAAPLTDGGLLLSAYSGVASDFARALGQHQQASGAGAAPTVADPGPIAVGAGALAYGVSLSTLAGVQPPGAPFKSILTQSDASLASDGDYAVLASAGSVDPQWTWFYNAPGTWLATVLAVNPGGTAPAPGNVTVTTSTSGSSLPTNGYSVALDGGTAQPISINGSVTFSSVAAGSHTVVLSGVPGNCTVSGGPTQTVTVPSGGTATAPYSITCTTPPGNLTVTTSTSGLSLPTTSYTVTVDGTTSQAIAPNGSVRFTNLAPANHTVALSGVPSNCTVTSANPQTVTVPSGGTATASFAVNCTLPATQLAFVQQPPSVILLSAPFTVQVAAVNAQGNTVSSYTATVSIAIAHDASLFGNARLSGVVTATAVNGSQRSPA